MQQLQKLWTVKGQRLQKYVMGQMSNKQEWVEQMQGVQKVEDWPEVKLRICMNRSKVKLSICMKRCAKRQRLHEKDRSKDMDYSKSWVKRNKDDKKHFVKVQGQTLSFET